MVKECTTCMQFQAQNASMPLETTPPPSQPWQEVATDIFSLEGKEYLVIRDYFSKMHMVRKYPKGQTSAGKTIKFLKEIFSENGIPETIQSNNGPQYATAEFTDFCREWGIQHKTSSPNYPQSNGFAEAMVKITKHTLQKAKASGQDPFLALLNVRATPVDAHLPSPAEMLNQCKLRTMIPCKIHDNNPNTEGIHDCLDEKSENQKTGAKGCELAPPYAGQHVSWFNIR